MSKRYGVIVADPPWRYGNRGVNGAAEKHYPTMSAAELQALDVGSLALDDCVLLLWATWPLLDEAMALVRAWGFEYVTGLPWVKLAPRSIEDSLQLSLFGQESREIVLRPSWGTGFWVRGCSEPILICRRGRPALPESVYLGLISERFRHSKKPTGIHQIAETLEGPYVELFARERREGWDLFGNEVVGSIEVGSRD